MSVSPSFAALAAALAATFTATFASFSATEERVTSALFHRGFHVWLASHAALTLLSRMSPYCSYIVSAYAVSFAMKSSSRGKASRMDLWTQKDSVR